MSSALVLKRPAAPSEKVNDRTVPREISEADLGQGRDEVIDLVKRSTFDLLPDHIK
jgi:hypothetical protein